MPTFRATKVYRLKNKAILKKIFFAGVKAVNAYSAVVSKIKLLDRSIEIAGKKYSLDLFNRVIVVGAGKACYDMAKGIEDVLGRIITHGVVVTKYGHGGSLKHIKVFEASHPLPDMNGVKATEQIISMANNVDQQTLVIVLLSGGASSLLVAPEGISLNDKIITTSLLLKSGATIDELNIVRKHLSYVKGGKLASMFYPAKIVTLIISDVIGNRLDIIGSGPTYFDPSTPQQAIGIIKKYNLMFRIPEPVIKHLENKSMHDVQKRTNNRMHKHARNIIIADNRLAVETCKREATRYGLKPIVITTRLHGEAREVAHVLGSIACYIHDNKRGKSKHVCLISGGETTVTVKGKGRGGRNQELALAFAMDIQNMDISMLSAGTDGSDGPTDAAGAIVDGNTMADIKKSGMDPFKYLTNNDSYTLLNRIGALLKTGPTGTNVMDIQLILV